MLSSPKVLFLTDNHNETSVMEELLKEHVALTHVDSVSDIKTKLARGNYDAMFCAWNLREDALEETREAHPDLPVIVFSPKANLNDWAEVMGAGAFDMLVPPYDGRSVLAVLEQASASKDAVARQSSERGLTVVA